MYANKRQSMVSPSPMSPLSIPRPHSVTGTRQRQVSDTHSQMGDSSDTKNVRVVLRIRPSKPDDPSTPPRHRSVLVHPISSSEVRLNVDPATLAGGTGANNASGKRHPTFTFEHVLGETSSQTDLYDATAKDVVDEFIKGHNITFFAYGQTSSGKSYSMGTTGDDIDYSGTEFTPRTGLIPRTVHAIFEQAEEARARSGPGSSWECRLSFLELYNEEIIDLLSGTGIAISIREERDGRIVWSGVREVKVKSLAEVMDLLQEGSTRRKTGETSMNATSSRSHAIFSLTLVQKKRINVNFGLASPAPPETPSRQLKRPSSTIGLANGARSPTPSGSRVPPSSFTSPRPGMTRPNSVAMTSTSDDFVITTSKFNMVDLAGSERLKRTAAQGDRMKEGISINSGLLALGNVISTLGDPVKARGHIPYRDSKLTRMLQDSIGGNALTTMIACVSPIEANIGETINTIKYASRARNIKNSAKINQVEAGWDDVEHLQSSVLKLRKQLAALEADGKSSSLASSQENMRQTEKLVQRLAELQREHTELYDRYLQKCSDNMRLSSELRNRGPGDGDALAKFNETTVEPVILEYEKVVSALNTQLDELRGELSTVNDLYEEQTRQLEVARDRQAQSESYVQELRNRIAKLTERNTSSEAYIHDLETKLKSHSDKEDSHAEIVGELRKEIAKMRENNATLSQHTSELEVRLGKTESRNSDLTAQVERQERESERREVAYRDLEAHIALLDTTKDNKILLEELELRDLKIAELEQQLDEKVAFEERERSELLNAVEAERSIQAELRLRLASMQTSKSSTTGPVSPPPEPELVEGGPTAVTTRTPLRAAKELTPPESPRSDAQENDHESNEVAELRAALQQLAAKYDDAESKYSEAEHRIVELTNQLSEANLIHAELDDVVPFSPAPHSPDAEDDVSDAGTMLQTPKDVSTALSDSPTKSSGRRGSMPILSSSGNVATKGSGFRGGRGNGDSSRIRPQSLSQELLSAQSSATSPRISWGANSLLSSPTVPGSGVQTAQKSLRSPQSLEAELKFVHRVVEERDEELKDREAYIRQLEEQLRGMHVLPSLRPSAITINTLSSPFTPKKQTSSTIDLDDHTQAQALEIPLPPSPLPPLRPSAPKDDMDTLRPPVQREVGLSPRSVKRFSALKDSLNMLEHGGVNTDETQSRIDELVKEMEEKEASQRRIIEQQFIQIADLQKANNKLKEDLADKAPVNALYLDELREGRISLVKEKATVAATGTISDEATTTAALDELRAEHERQVQSMVNVHSQTVDAIHKDHATALESLRAEHEQKLQTIVDGHARAIDGLQHEHVAALDSLRATVDTNEAAQRLEMATLQKQHDDAIKDLQKAHADKLKAIQDDHELIAQEMESSLSQSEEQRRQLKMKADQALFELSRVRDQHVLQRNSEAKAFADLTKANAVLEKIRKELEVANAELQNGHAELMKRNAELEQRFSRKSALPPPPQGPPPTTPLPPIPRSPSGMFGSNGGVTSPSSANERERGHDYFHRGSVSSAGHSEVHQDKDRERVDSANERDGLKTELSAGKEKVREAEAKLQEVQVKVANLNNELREVQKTNSKLRAHLEDCKQEQRQTTEACKDHMDELNARREQMSKLSEDERSHRDSLQAANAQLANLRAQLDRAVDQKVNKKLNSRLKCF